MIKVKQVHSRTDLEDVFTIRRKVFVEEQKVPADLEYDDYDDEGAVHYVATLNGKIVGAARWITTDEGYKLQRFAVLPEARGNGVGSELVKTVLDDIPSDGKKIYLHSQESAVGLYLRHGFVIEGERFEEAGIGHYKMVLKM
ncbi:GNAT family N-acetyltransferase [Solitalea koreensis]|uniref:Predicted N-acyltransferase, GNAT family n=1 Tax=Solitalea koreensis TaxID=543615 RepID=A0A521D9Z9_9SPHI|nr:GNAT family N-acetyltransferase [Solitalea koreensis]SMO67730.1 Predicted N-acyltransferase, GNAT family [Solitalea koreensis]